MHLRHQGICLFDEILPILNIIILQTGEFQYCRSHISGVGPGGAVYAQVCNLSGRDLILNIAVVPGTALAAARGDERAGSRCSTSCRKEEPIRVSKCSKGRCAEWVGSDHVQNLHTNMICL